MTVMVFAMLGAPLFASAQSAPSYSLTITPPLVQVSLDPGTSWSSSVKIVNGNDYSITVYASPEDFVPQGEEGASVFQPLNATTTGDNGYSLAGWIELPQQSFFISAGGHADIPYTIHVPTDASPGGHYAGILVGSRAPSGTGQINISSQVASLLLLRVSGDVHEAGFIRDFYADHSFYTTPDATFTFRFTNTGNTHLLPQGEIAIYNMWGKERGKIFVNADTHFGSVLPQSTRRFTFEWSGEANIFDWGLYHAIATVEYGTELHQNESATTYFWVIPVVPILELLAMLVLALGALIFLVRTYIRRALALQTEMLRDVYGIEPRVDARSAKKKRSAAVVPEGVIGAQLRMFIEAFKMPIPDDADIPATAIGRVWQHIGQYRFLLALIGVLIIFAAAAIMYMSAVLSSDRSFDISVKSGDSKFPITSEEVEREQIEGSAPDVLSDPSAPGGPVRSGASFEGDSSLMTAEERQSLDLSILNLSDTSAVAVELGIALDKAGFKAQFLEHDTPGDWTEGIYYKTGELREAAAVQSVAGEDYVLKEVAPSTTPALPDDVMIVVGKK